MKILILILFILLCLCSDKSVDVEIDPDVRAQMKPWWWPDKKEIESFEITQKAVYIFIASKDRKLIEYRKLDRNAYNNIGITIWEMDDPRPEKPAGGFYDKTR